MLGYLRHLANFAHIVETGSITGAANKLDCSPSTMSESVKILEAYFGEPLLERRQRGVFPTGKGAAIFENCHSIVQSCESALGLPTDQRSGTIKISLPSEFLLSFGVRLLHRLKQESPDIRVVLAAENEVLDHTKFARDLYVRVGREEATPKLTILHSGRENVVLVGTPKAVQGIDVNDPNAVSSCVYLAGISSGPEQKLKLSNPSGQIKFAQAVQVGSIEARIAMMRESLGITACLKSTVQDEISKGSVLNLLPDRFGFSRVVTIGTPHRSPSPLGSFVAKLISEIHGELAEGPT